MPFLLKGKKHGNKRPKSIHTHSNGNQTYQRQTKINARRCEIMTKIIIILSAIGGLLTTIATYSTEFINKLKGSETNDKNTNICELQK